MNTATRSQLRAQYNRAKKLGWIEHFREAANSITVGFFDTADLMGIGSRETNLDPKWIQKKGDNGHGAGLMQIDDRSFPEFTNSDNWKDARKGIMYGAKVLMQKWHDMERGFGKQLTVRSSKGRSAKYVGKKAVGQVAQAIAISSYNCGRWAQYAYSRGVSIDAYTTGKDYSRDVIYRAAAFREMLAADGLLDRRIAPTGPEDPHAAPRPDDDDPIVPAFLAAGEIDHDDLEPGEDLQQPAETQQQPAEGQQDLSQLPNAGPGGQVAENLTNINTGDKNVPDNFEPENKVVGAPPPANMLQRGWTWLAALGLIPAGGAGLLETFKGYMADGSINWREVIQGSKEVFLFLMPYLFWVAIAFVAFWGLKELLKQISFIVTQYTLARGDMNNVYVKPTAPPPATTWSWLPSFGSAPLSIGEDKR